ncbi:MAG: hypothetical protein P4M12_11145 [Gammaproteobacteria bacterium]|nr:hypothetical protein [Gammaproteobacteria bacterium]
MSPSRPLTSSSIEEHKQVQLHVPLLEGEASNTTALRILQAINDKTDKVNWKDGQEIIIAFGSLLAAASSASTGKSFSENIVEGFFSGANAGIKKAATWVIATPAILAQFSFSLNSNLTLGIKIKRYIKRTASSDIWQQKTKVAKSLSIVLPTIFGTVVMGKKAFEGSTEGFLWTICAFRALSALGANMDFYLQRQKNSRGLQDTLIIRLILSAQANLNHLAQTNSMEYIQTLSRHRIISSICNRDLQNPDKADLENILDSLLNAFPAEAQSSLKSNESKSIKYSSLILGALVSLINWKAATKVPALFGLNVPADLKDVYENPAWLYSPGFLLGAILFGLPSAYVNTAINSISCSRLFNTLKKVHKNIRHHGLKNYLNTFSKQDWVILLFGLTTFSLGYGLSNGGSGYLYPFIDAAKIPNGIFATVVFTAIGFMSLDSSGNQASNIYHRQLFNDFIKNENPEHFFNQLTPEKQQKIVVLINTYLNLVFDSLLDDFNNLDMCAAEKLFTPDFLNKLNNHFQPSTPGTPVEPAAVMSINGTPSKDGLFGNTLISSRPIPCHPNRIKRNISTDKLSAPSEFRETISPAPSPRLFGHASRSLPNPVPEILENDSNADHAHSYTPETSNLMNA